MSTSTFKRIKERRTQRRIKALKKLAMFLLAVLCLTGIYFLLHQPWFSFGTLYVTGTEKLQREEILHLTGLKEPINLFLIDRNNIHNVLINDLRIKNVAVAYEMPNILRIDIQEETPLFYVMSAYGYIGVNDKGQIISANKTIKNAAAPIVSGVATGTEFLGDMIGNETALEILAFLVLLDRNTLYNISELNLLSDNKLRIFDLAGRLYLLGELDAIQQKTKAFSAIIKELSEKNLSVEFVDLSYSKPYIKIKRQ